MLIMGLDNGFYVKSNKRQITREILPNIINYPFDNDYNNEVEIVYWRKNWGLRNAIMSHFGWLTAPEDQYKFEIDSPKQVLSIIEIIASFLNEEKWEDEGNSIWNYEQVRPVLLQNIINFAAIHIFMCENPDVYLEFYDSY